MIASDILEAALARLPHDSQRGPKCGHMGWAVQALWTKEPVTVETVYSKTGTDTVPEGLLFTMTCHCDTTEVTIVATCFLFSLFMR